MNMMNASKDSISSSTLGILRERSSLMRSSPVKFFNQYPQLLHVPLHLFFVHKLEELGYQVQIVDRILPGDGDDLYFITFGNCLNLPRRYILYNFEYGDAHLNHAGNIKMYNGAVEVWDYSTRNITRMALTGTKHVFVPFLPCDYPDIVDKMRAFVAPVKTHEYLFYGVMNQKRRRVIDAFSAEHGPVLEVGYQCRNEAVTGEALFALLGSTKYVLNAHFYEGDPVMEIYRILECQMLGVHVLSQDGFMDDVYKSRLTNLSIVIA